MGYDEQVMVKMQMAMLLEKLDPMSQDFDDKLEHIRGAVAHHMYQEEGTWFVELSEKAPAAGSGNDHAAVSEGMDALCRRRRVTKSDQLLFR